MRPRWIALAVVALATTLGACGRGGGDGAAESGAEGRTVGSDTGAGTRASADLIDQERRARRRVEAIEAELASYEALEGRRKAGDATSTFTAYLRGDSLVLIRERLDMGDYGYSDNEYYFAGDSLIYYVEGKLSRTRNPDGPPTTDAIVLRLYFDEQGRLSAHEKTLNAEPVELDGYEESAVRRHATALRALIAGDEQASAAALAGSGPVQVELVAGEALTTLRGRVAAREVRNYLIEAEEGQTMSVRMNTESRFAHFVVQFKGQNVFDSSRSGERDWSARLPRTGEYTVRVFLTRVEAQRGGKAEYELTIGLEKAAGQDADPAPGLPSVPRSR